MGLGILVCLLYISNVESFPTFLKWHPFSIQPLQVDRRAYVVYRLCVSVLFRRSFVAKKRERKKNYPLLLEPLVQKKLGSKEAKDLSAKRISFPYFRSFLPEKPCWYIVSIFVLYTLVSLVWERNKAVTMWATKQAIIGRQSAGNKYHY